MKSLNKDAVEKLVNLKAKIQDLKIDGIDQIEIPVIGTGSTPGKSYLKRFFVRPYLGCSQPIPEYEKLDEIHPGNYCFYDSRFYLVHVLNLMSHTMFSVELLP